MLAKLVRIAVFFALFVIILITISSWFFFARTGIFLDYELLSFGVSNLSAIIIHLMQTSRNILFIVYGLTTIVTLLILHYISKRYAIKKKLLFRIFQINAAFLLVGLSVQLTIHFSAKEIKYRHPIASFIGDRLDNGYFSEMQIDVMPFLQKRFVENEYSQIGKEIQKSPVIVLMIESMRRDIDAVDPSPIPFIKTLKKESIFFDKAYAPASHSNYADLAVWYSQYPLRFSGRYTYSQNDPWRGISIFHVFKCMGYKTAYISFQNEKWGNMISWLNIPEIDYFYHSENYNGRTWVNKDDAPGLISLIKRGIATAGKIEDSETLRISREWINSLSSGTPFFLGINLQNTHFSYVIPEGGEEPFQPSTIDFPTVYYGWSKNKVEEVRNRYFNAFYNLDKFIQEFVVFLKQKGIWDKCWFLIIGDSGEAFYEHDFGNHSGPMYEEVVRTFCLMKPPKGKDSKIVEKPINLIDIFPGLLNLMGASGPNCFQGVSPFDERKKRSSIYLHSNAIIQQDGLVKWPWKLLSNIYPIKYLELYNLENDPNEKINQYLNKQKIAIQMQNELLRWRKIQVEYYSNPEYYQNYCPPKYLEE